MKKKFTQFVEGLLTLPMAVRLSLFDGNANTPATNTTADAGLSGEMKTFYSQKRRQDHRVPQV